jgi:heat shock protein HslJ
MKVLLASVFCWLLLGMKPVSENFHENKKTVKTINDLPLQNTHWQLIELNGKKIAANAASKPMYLVFKSDSTVKGNGGCNSFSGGYATGKNNEISFGELVRTNVLCPAIEYERNYLNALAKTNHYQIMGNTLSLQNKFTVLAKFSGKE